MRAIVCDDFGPFANLNIRDIPEPDLKSSEVLVNVKAAGVSFAQSLKVAGKYQLRPSLPFVPGSEVSGVVSAVADDVTHVSIGDRVFSPVASGGFAEKVAVRSIDCKKIPKCMDYGEAVLFPISYPTAYAALTWKARLEPGETVLVHGATGAVGMAAVEISKAKGAEVIATVSADEKGSIAKDHGADLAINYTKTDLRSAIKEQTGGKGVDVVIDPIGGTVLFESMRAMNREGRLITLGYASGSIPEPPVNLLLVKNMSIIGLNFGTYIGWSPNDDGLAYIDKLDALHDDLAGMFNAGQLQPEVSHHFALERFNEAMNNVLTRKSVGKVVLEP